MTEGCLMAGIRNAGMLAAEERRRSVLMPSGKSTKDSLLFLSAATAKYLYRQRKFSEHRSDKSKARREP
jgi:hypothetical protein